MVVICQVPWKKDEVEWSFPIMKSREPASYNATDSLVQRSVKVFEERLEQAYRVFLAPHQRQTSAVWKASLFHAAPHLLDRLLDCRTFYGVPIPIHHREYDDMRFDIYSVGGRLVLVNSTPQDQAHPDIAVFTSTNVDDIIAYDDAALWHCFYPYEPVPTVDGRPIIRRAAVSFLHRQLFDGLQGYYTERRDSEGLNRALEMHNRGGDVHSSWFNLQEGSEKPENAPPEPFNDASPIPFKDTPPEPFEDALLDSDDEGSSDFYVDSDGDSTDS